MIAHAGVGARITRRLGELWTFARLLDRGSASILVAAGVIFALLALGARHLSEVITYDAHLEPQVERYLAQIQQLESAVLRLDLVFLLDDPALFDRAALRVRAADLEALLENLPEPPVALAADTGRIRTHMVGPLVHVRRLLADPEPEMIDFRLAHARTLEALAFLNRLGHALAAAKAETFAAYAEQLSQVRYELVRAMIASLLGGAVLQALAIGVAITRIRKRRAETLVVATNQRLHDAIESIRDGFAYFDADDRLVICNTRFRAWHGDLELGRELRFAEVVRHTAAAGRFETDDPEAYARQRIELHRRADGREIEERRKGGQWLQVREVRSSEGGTVGLWTDITHRKHNEEQIRHLAQHDALTDLPNRLLFLQRLEEALRLASERDEQVALLALDLDNFKQINDTLGHATGDQLLVSVAGRLRGALRRDDTVSRLSGDEFAIILNRMSAREDALVVARHLLRELSVPFRLQGDEIACTGSIGIALFPDDGCDGAELLCHADLALYRAKDEGRGTYRSFAPELSFEAIRRKEVEQGLRRALEQNGLSVAFQPQFDLATRRLVGAEALLRWYDPESGRSVSPAEFIPIAERSGLTFELDLWVLATTCRLLRRWRPLRCEPFSVSVNLSPADFRQVDLVERILRVLERYQVHPSWIEFEITEGVLMDDGAATRLVLEHFQAAGLRLALDDFGTGFSSLGYLKQLPVDKLKIDRSFVVDLDQDRNDQAIVRAVVAIGHALDLTVVAEGIETEAQADRLREIGCDIAQGFLFGRPMAADQIAALLAPGRPCRHSRHATSAVAAPVR